MKFTYIYIYLYIDHNLSFTKCNHENDTRSDIVVNSEVASDVPTPKHSFISRKRMAELPIIFFYVALRRRTTGASRNGTRASSKPEREKERERERGGERERERERREEKRREPHSG